MWTGIMKCNIVHVLLKKNRIFFFKLVAQIQCVSSDRVAVRRSDNRTQSWVGGRVRLIHVGFIECEKRLWCSVLCLSLLLTLWPIACVLQKVKKERTPSCWGSISQSVLGNKPLSKPSKCVPVRLSCDRRAIKKKVGRLKETTPVQLSLGQL